MNILLAIFVGLLGALYVNILFCHFGGVLRFGRTVIFKEKAGVISFGRCWVCFHGSYGYFTGSFTRLLWTLATEWNDDRHLIG